MMGVDVAATTRQGFSEEALRALSRLREDPEWVLAHRLEGWRSYLATPMPSRKEEEWRRTDLSMLDLERVVPFVERLEPVAKIEELPAPVRAVARTSVNQGGLLVHRNSWLGYRQLTSDLAAKGVIFADLNDAFREYPELVRRHFMGGAAPAAGKLVALHSAFFNGGTFLYVPRNVEVAVPLHAVTWADSAGLGLAPHTLVVAETGSRVALVDEFASPGGLGPTLANGVSELVVGDGAQVTYLALQRWGNGVFNFGHQRSVVGRDAELASLSVVLGSRLTKSWVEAALSQPGARVQMVGIMFADGKQRFHHHTLQDHQAPNTTSDLLYKAVLSDEARSEYSGLIRVHKDAQKTDAYQANRNLLLSRNARADSMPKLEIEANDVRCTHGATVGPIDEEQIFYLMARGLPRSTAEKMIVEGFFEPVMERIPLEVVRERVRQAVETKLSLGGR